MSLQLELPKKDEIQGNEGNENHFEDFLGLVGIGSGAKRKVEQKKRKKIKNE